MSTPMSPAVLQALAIRLMQQKPGMTMATAREYVTRTRGALTPVMCDVCGIGLSIVTTELCGGAVITEPTDHTPTLMCGDCWEMNDPPTMYPMAPPPPNHAMAMVVLLEPTDPRRRALLRNMAGKTGVGITRDAQHVRARFSREEPTYVQYIEMCIAAQGNRTGEEEMKTEGTVVTSNPNFDVSKPMSVSNSPMLSRRVTDPAVEGEEVLCPPMSIVAFK